MDNTTENKHSIYLMTNWFISKILNNRTVAKDTPLSDFMALISHPSSWHSEATTPKSTEETLALVEEHFGSVENYALKAKDAVDKYVRATAATGSVAPQGPNNAIFQGDPNDTPAVENYVKDVTQAALKEVEVYNNKNLSRVLNGEALDYTVDPNVFMNGTSTYGGSSDDISTVGGGDTTYYAFPEAPSIVGPMPMGDLNQEIINAGGDPNNVPDTTYYAFPEAPSIVGPMPMGDLNQEIINAGGDPNNVPDTTYYAFPEAPSIVGPMPMGDLNQEIINAGGDPNQSSPQQSNLDIARQQRDSLQNVVNEINNQGGTPSVEQQLNLTLANQAVSMVESNPNITWEQARAQADTDFQNFSAGQGAVDPTEAIVAGGSASSPTPQADWSSAVTGDEAIAAGGSAGDTGAPVSELEAEARRKTTEYINQGYGPTQARALADADLDQFFSGMQGNDGVSQLDRNLDANARKLVESNPSITWEQARAQADTDFQNFVQSQQAGQGAVTGDEAIAAAGGAAGGGSSGFFAQDPNDSLNNFGESF